MVLSCAYNLSLRICVTNKIVNVQIIHKTYIRFPSSPYRSICAIAYLPICDDSPHHCQQWQTLLLPETTGEEREYIQHYQIQNNE